MAGYGTGGSWSSPSQLPIAPLAPRSDALARGTPGFMDGCSEWLVSGAHLAYNVALQTRCQRRGEGAEQDE
jgi:hypothetical protein